MTKMNHSMKTSGVTCKGTILRSGLVHNVTNNVLESPLWVIAAKLLLMRLAFWTTSIGGCYARRQ